MSWFDRRIGTIGRTPYAVLFACGLSLIATQVLAQPSLKLNVQDVIERVMTVYPTLQVTKQRVDVARQEIHKVQAQLGWTLNAAAGLAHDVNAFEVPVDRASLSAGANRLYETGHRVELSGKYNYEEATSVFSPLLSNPSERSQLDVRYRIPFGRGEDNVSYQQALAKSKLGIALEQAEQKIIVNSLLAQIIDIYYAYALTYSRHQDIQTAIDRSERFEKFVQRNRRMGLFENKDWLEARSQLNLRQSQLSANAAVLTAQRQELCRLMRYPEQTEWAPEINSVSVPDESAKPTIVDEVWQASPELARARIQYDVAHADIVQRQDDARDQLDMVLSTGVRFNHNSNAAGTTDRQELVAGVQFEYTFSADKQGVDAQKLQSVLRRQIAQDERARISDDLRYRTVMTLSQLQETAKALQSAQAHTNVEDQLLADAISRHQVGRATTSDVVRYENSYHAAVLTTQLNRIELAKLNASLMLARGALWSSSAAVLNSRVRD